MDPNMFVALMNAILVIAQKDARTREETLAYGNFLDYAGSIARFNRLLVEDEIGRKLDEEVPNAPRRPSPAARVA